MKVEGLEIKYYITELKDIVQCYWKNIKEVGFFTELDINTAGDVNIVAIWRIKKLKNSNK